MRRIYLRQEGDIIMLRASYPKPMLSQWPETHATSKVSVCHTHPHIPKSAVFQCSFRNPLSAQRSPFLSSAAQHP